MARRHDAPSGNQCDCRYADMRKLMGTPCCRDIMPPPMAPADWPKPPAPMPEYATA